jgi:hypothetical protein
MARTHAAGEHIMYAVMSHNNKSDVANGVPYGSTPRLYDLTNRVQLSWCSAV